MLTVLLRLFRCLRTARVCGRNGSEVERSPSLMAWVAACFFSPWPPTMRIKEGERSTSDPFLPHTLGNRKFDTCMRARHVVVEHVSNLRLPRVCGRNGSEVERSPSLMAWVAACFFGRLRLARSRRLVRMDGGYSHGGRPGRKEACGDPCHQRR
jgi:hypothetical protein